MKRTIQNLKCISKKALSLILAFMLFAMTIPSITVDAANGDVTGNNEFKVIAYYMSAQIKMPQISGATNYKVYMSKTSGLTADFSSASCVFNSDTYQPTVCFQHNDKDKLSPDKNISIYYSPNTGANNKYYFYLVTTGTTSPLQSTSESTTRDISTCYWTSPGNYDTSWFYNNKNATIYNIDTPQQLAGLAVLTNGCNDLDFEHTFNFIGKTIKLNKSIDMSANIWEEIGKHAIVQSGCDNLFGGTFDGGIYNGTSGALSGSNEISNLCTFYFDESRYNSRSTGLFGGCMEGSTIKNIGIVDEWLVGLMKTGAVVGITKGDIINCYNTGTVIGLGQYNDGITGQYTGGIAGHSYGNITDCYNTGTVSSMKKSGRSAVYISGIVGLIQGESYKKCAITKCYNTGTVLDIIGTYDNASVSYISGIVGSLGNGTISECYNTGELSGDHVNGVIYGIGGGEVIDCYNTGKLSGISACGVIGYVGDDGKVRNCYNTGTVSSTDGIASGFVDRAMRGTVENCYNKGAVNSTRGSASGFAGSVGGCLINCYNTGTVSCEMARRPKNYGEFIDNYAGGIAVEVDGGLASNCYNTGKVSGAAFAGGIAGATSYSGGSVKNCYNTAAVSGSLGAGGVMGSTGAGGCDIRYSYNTGLVNGDKSVGGFIGYRNRDGINNCYYVGNYYCGAVSGFGDWPFFKTEGASPFISYKTPLGKGRSTDIVEVTPTTIDAEFKKTFGITNIQYPDTYESSDTDIITVKDKNITAINIGTAFAKAKAGVGEKPNDQIIITQNELNMTGSELGFTGPEITVIGNVSLPVVVDNSTNGYLPIAVTPSAIANSMVGQQVTLSATLVGETANSGKTITFAIADASNNPVALVKNTATTDTSGVATLTNGWTSTTAGTYKLTVSYTTADGKTTKTGTTPITVNKNTPTVTMSISPNSPSKLGTSVTITPSITGIYGTISPNGYEYYIDGTKYTSSTASYTFTPNSVKDYSIYVKYIDSNNEATSGTVTYTIGKATPTITLADKKTGNTYNGSAFSIGTATLTGVSGASAPTGTIAYTYYTDKSGTLTTKVNSGTVADGGAPVKAGTYYVKASYPGDSNYNAVDSALATLVINKKALSITNIIANDRAYDGTTVVKLTGGSLSGIEVSDNVTVPISAVIENKNVGNSKPVTFSDDLLGGTDANNYTLTASQLTVNITPVTLIATITPNNKIYDGNATATADSIGYTGKFGTDDVDITGGALTFSSKDVANGISVTASGYTLSGKDAVNYTLGTVTVNKTANITTKVLNVTPNSLSKYFGQPDPVITYSFNGNITGETPTFTGTLTRTPGEAVGDYEINMGNLVLADSSTFKLANYTVIFNSGAIRVSIIPEQRVYTVTVNNGTSSGNYTAGSPITIKAKTPQAGQRFKAWTVVNGGVTLGNATSETTTFKMPANAVVVTANYEDISVTKTYTVSYNANGGTGSISPQKINVGTATTLTKNTFVRTDYTFKEWNTKADGKGTRYTDSLPSQTAGTTITLYAQWTEITYNVTGNVVDNKDAVVSDADVKLMKGNKQIGETVKTNSDGKFAIAKIPNGTYNLVVSKDGIIVTSIIVISSVDKATGTIKLPSGKTNSIVDVKPNTPQIVVGNLENQFSDDDKDIATDGGCVEIKLTAKGETNTAPNARDISAIASSNGKTVGQFIDLSVLKTVTPKIGDVTSTNLNELQNLVEIFIPLDTALQGKTEYVMYRYHGNAVNTITTLANPDGEKIELIDGGATIKLTVKKFSIYAIAYKNTPTGGEPEKLPIVKPLPPKKPAKNPQTGDNTPLELPIAFATLGIALMALGLYLKRKQQSAE